jgi:hypothetical protein
MDRKFKALSNSPQEISMKATLTRMDYLVVVDSLKYSKVTHTQETLYKVFIKVKESWGSKMEIFSQDYSKEVNFKKERWSTQT